MHRLLKPLLPFSKIFRDAGFELHLVGGAVRNIVLGKDPVDFDFATNATPNQVMGLFKRVIPTGVEHGTVTVLFRGEQYEVTTYRTEGTYSDGRHPDSVAFTSSIEEDLSRRDFTINGMALELPSGKLLDPFDGQQDIRRRRIEAIGEPAERFNEDGLRILRAVRFAAQLDFGIEEKTFQAMKSVRHRLGSVAKERIRDELEKALLSDHPATALELLKEAELLGYTVPELQEATGATQGSDSDLDLFRHSALVCAFMPPEIALRLAGLLHDVAKAWTVEQSEDGRLLFPDHDKKSATVADKRLRDLRFPNKVIERTTTLIRNHMFSYTSAQGDNALRRMVSRLGEETVFDLITLRRADVAGKRGRLVPLPLMDEMEDRLRRILAQESALSLKDLEVNGNDLMREAGIPAGKELGTVLSLLLETVLDDPEMNSRDRLIELARNIYREQVNR